MRMTLQSSINLIMYLCIEKKFWFLVPPLFPIRLSQEILQLFPDFKGDLNLVHKLKANKFLHSKHKD